ALGRLDGNHDQVIDRADAAFKDILVWQDLNHDGISQSGELLTLAQKGIASIGLETSANGQWQGSNQILTNGHFTYIDGHSGTLAEVAFKYGGESGTQSRSPQAGGHLDGVVGNQASMKTGVISFDHLLQGNDLAYDMIRTDGVGGRDVDHDQGATSKAAGVATMDHEAMAWDGLGSNVGGSWWSLGESSHSFQGDAGVIHLGKELARILPKNDGSMTMDFPHPAEHQPAGDRVSAAIDSIVSSTVHGDYLATLGHEGSAGQDHGAEHVTVADDPVALAGIVAPVEEFHHHPVHGFGAG
ncbi:MAG: hypothetical protein HQL73_04060, partial [Magnetococcales bacterium]|nr:hypothetical protein [Magnetococcales bacterium]